VTSELGSHPPRIQTDRLLLREWRDSDLDPFAALCASPEVMRHFPATLSAREASDLVARNQQNWEVLGLGLWAVELLDHSSDFIGYVGLAPADFLSPGVVEVGWRLAQKHWGNGYAPEAATHVLADAFLRLELQEVVSFTVPANQQSWRVMEKIGMTRDRSRDFEHPRVDPALHPQLVSHHLWSITRDDFLSLHANHP